VRRQIFSDGIFFARDLSFVSILSSPRRPALGSSFGFLPPPVQLQRADLFPSVRFFSRVERPGRFLLERRLGSSSRAPGVQLVSRSSILERAPVRGQYLLRFFISLLTQHTWISRRSDFLVPARCCQCSVSRCSIFHPVIIFSGSSDGLFSSFDFELFDTCESYLLEKITKSSFIGQSERTSDLLGLVHTDVCGSMSSVVRCDFQYFITFIDDFSRYGYMYVMRHKSESFEKFKKFQNEVQNQLGKTIKFLRSDRGGEYLNLEFSDHLKQCEIVSQLTLPGTPQRNGVSERRNRTLLDMVRSMMRQTDLPLSFWGYALETTAFTLNRVSTKSVERTPYEIWTEKHSRLSFLKV
jgi:hypothetical protein